MDATVLQYQNQKLIQQLEAQKAEMHALDGKFKDLEDKQISYDNTLIAVNKMWNQVFFHYRICYATSHFVYIFN